ncbi:hypothetical protein [Arthrobacter sp. G119Y2]|uniref:hypothetical protein n=1 Tax=Arthrobacter sp. G119Y2 TaxID=3134965 RepID=UPI00311968C9
MESFSSREHPSFEHSLRVLVRIDTQLQLACLEVRGCLTADTCSTLINILTHTGTLGAAVSVNLLRAAHVEEEALELLCAGAGAAVDTGAETRPVEILAPPDLPVCRLGPVPAAQAPPGAGSWGLALTNEDAATLITQRDSQVLADRNGCRPRKR